jgi:hypothetical protein
MTAETSSHPSAAISLSFSSRCDSSSKRQTTRSCLSTCSLRNPASTVGSKILTPSRRVSPTRICRTSHASEWTFPTARGSEL